MIIAIGSIINLTNFYDEAKHRPLKQYARAISSRKNVCYSIAVKQQKILSNLLIKLQSNNLPYVTYKKSNSLVYHKKCLLKNYINCTQVKSVSFENIVLKRGSIILIEINDENYPVFEEIADIFKTNTNVSLYHRHVSVLLSNICLQRTLIIVIKIMS